MQSMALNYIENFYVRHYNVHIKFYSIEKYFRAAVRLNHLQWVVTLAAQKNWLHESINNIYQRYHKFKYYFKIDRH